MNAALSVDAKDALARETPQAAHCRDALFFGLAIYGGRRNYFRTHRNAIARFFRALAPAKMDLHVTRSGSMYRVLLPRFSAVPKPVRRCDRIMEARAAFMACGSISAGAQGYHLEFAPATQDCVKRLQWVLGALGCRPKLLRRKQRSVLYFKDFEAIVEFLTITGAHNAVLQLEDLRALKETKNRIHRLVNTEAANLERTAIAAANQRKTIAYVADAYGLHKLNPALREIADLRLQYPDESLNELGRRCRPPISKPAVNGRLAALARLAEALASRAR